jgi:hypothetical protein
MLICQTPTRFVSSRTTCHDESNETLPNGFPDATIQFHCQQKDGAALVVMEVTKTVPPAGACSLVFDTGASVADVNASPVRVEDGACTTYVYPISNAPVQYATRTAVHTDQHKFLNERPWSTAEALGSGHVISYLVVFRPAGAPEPKVSDISLTSNGGQNSAAAKVDGAQLSVSF